MKQYSNAQLPSDLGAVFFDDLVTYTSDAPGHVEDDGMFYSAKNYTFEAAKTLRSEETLCEKLLWERLRKSQLDGFRFRRQHPIDKYIADFYCHKARLVVEADGSIHLDEHQIQRDTARNEHMALLGITTLRFTNQQIEFNIEDVLNQIRIALSERMALPLQAARGVVRS